MTRAPVDLAVVGAGPAGMAAATMASALGLSTVVFDMAPAPGGQVYRGLEHSPVKTRAILGGDYWRGETLLRAFRGCGASYFAQTTVWAIAPGRDALYDVAVLDGSPSASGDGIHPAHAIIVATGAVERPFPIPGWTLPGVFTAGGIQALLKTSAFWPAGRVVFAGSGPLLWLAAWQALQAGANVACLLETVPRGRLVEALPHVPAFLASAYWRRGLAIVRAVRRRVDIVEHVERLEALGDSRVSGVRYRSRGRERHCEATTLVVSQGVVPQLDVASALGCELRWNERQACYEPVLDAHGGTTREHLWIAGDAGGIAGADAAQARGRLAALAAANALGHIDASRRDREAESPLHELRRALRGREFLDALYRPPAWLRRPSGSTLVCRCEEVSAQVVRDAAAATGGVPAEVRARTRCGMGPCQGRMCALTLAELCAQVRGVSPSQVAFARARFPLQPVPLEKLACWPATADADRAVVPLVADAPPAAANHVPGGTVLADAPRPEGDALPP